jgi:hypothetical protein
VTIITTGFFFAVTSMETFMMSMLFSVMMFFFAASIIFVIVSFITHTIVFVSPGWAVVKSDIYVEPTDAMLPQDDGIHPEMQPDDLSLSPTY